MQLSHEARGDVLVVTVLERRLDASGAKSFKAQFEAFVADGHKRIVLDLERVEFVDSTGLGAIVSGLKMLVGGEIVVANACATVASIFKLTRMDKVFRIVAGVEEALSALTV